MATESLFARYKRALELEPRLRAAVAEINKICESADWWEDNDHLVAWREIIKPKVRPLIGWERPSSDGGDEWLRSQAAWDAVTEVLVERMARAEKRWKAEAEEDE